MEVPFNLPTHIFFENIMHYNNVQLKDIFSLSLTCKKYKFLCDENFWELIVKIFHPKLVKLDDLTWKILVLLLINRNNLLVTKVPFDMSLIYIRQLLLFKSATSLNKLAAYQYIVSKDVRYYKRVNKDDYTDETSIIIGKNKKYDNIVLALNYYDALFKLSDHYPKIINNLKIDYEHCNDLYEEEYYATIDEFIENVIDMYKQTNYGTYYHILKYDIL